MQPSERADLNLRILEPLARWVRDLHGAEALDAVAAAAGLRAADFDGSTRWVSLESFEAALAAARPHAADDSVFKEACAYKMAEGYGPLRFIAWAATPSLMYATAFRNWSAITRISTGEIVERSAGHIVTRYRSTRAESRLLCLSRQGQAVTLPTMWGLPPAVLTEHSCIAHGDPTCEYRLRFYQPRRWLPAMLGLGLGLAGAAAFSYAGLELATSPLLALAGLLGGALWEARRADRANLGTARQIHEALTALARGEAEARREIVGFGERQREWTRLMERELAAKTAAAQPLVSALAELREERASRIRGFSHDVRNPLQILRANLWVLGSGVEGLEREEILAEATLALEQADVLVGRMIESASADFVGVKPQRIDTAGLTETLARRLRALCYGKDVRVSAFMTHEAPETIDADPMLIDRVMDNLLTNAAKYTERGSIVLEVAGGPDRLTVKLSDTGRGMQPSAVEAAFRPGGCPESERDGHGVGLSVVISLLAQVGGRLEVLSRPKEGTTFWVHLPASTRTAAEVEEVATRVSEPHEETVRRVVTVRASLHV